MHQLRTDWRHFRLGLAGLWIVFFLSVWLSPSVPSSAGPLSLRSLPSILLAFLAVLLTVLCVQADPFSGSNSAWMTRPISRRTLWASKSLFVILFIVCPWLLAQTLTWWQLRFTAAQCVQAGIEIVATALAVLFFSATLAAQTRNLATFFATATVVIGVFFSGLILWYVVHLDRLARPFIARTDREWASQHTSAWAAASGFFLIACGSAWIAQTWLRRRDLSRGLLLAAMLLVIPVSVLWRYDFLRSEPKQVTGLAVEVLEADAPEPPPPPGEQILWSHFRITGLKERQWAMVADLDGRFRPDANGEPPAESIGVRSSQRPWSTPGYMGSIEQYSPQAPDCYRVIKRNYPAETLWASAWLTMPFSASAALPVVSSPRSDWARHPRQGVFLGTMTLQLFDVVRMAELPLRPGAVGRLPGERLTLENVLREPGGVRIDLRLRSASLQLSRDERLRKTGSGASGFRSYLFVLYQPRFGEASLVRVESASVVQASVANIERNLTGQLKISLPALRLRLTGITLEEWLRDARLDAYILMPSGTSTLDFDQEHYTFRSSPPAQNEPSVFHRRRRAQEPREVLLAKLAEKRQPLEPISLLRIAEAKDPTTYAALAWHFEHLQYGQDMLIPVLARCSGFDLPAAIRTAWKRARLGFVSPNGLALSAAALGLPGALAQEIIFIEGIPDEANRQKALQNVAGLVDYSGPADDFGRWLSDHIDQFQYDSARHRYRLAGEARNPGQSL